MFPPVYACTLDIEKNRYGVRVWVVRYGTSALASITQTSTSLLIAVSFRFDIYLEVDGSRENIRSEIPLLIHHMGGCLCFNRN